jgi:PEP-CTERM motif
MFKRIFGAALAVLVIPVAAHAAQFQASGGIFNGSDHGSSYVGAGGATPLYNQALGQVVDGGKGAFDAFGFYNSGVGSLSQTRQVELLSGNVFRFFDTFTNTGGSSVTTTLNFFGNLGSDGDELISLSKAGLIVSCEDDWTGHCGSDPVLALVSGNNGLGQASITPDRYNVSFSVTVNPGQSLSLLNFAFLASELDGPTAADVALAQATGQSLLQAPRLEGLSAQQIASIANFAAPVPEPTTWGLMALGLGLIGVRLRSRRAAQSATAC